MAVVGSAKEMPAFREAMRGQNGRRGYVQVWRVITDAITDDAPTVLGAQGLPTMYAPYSASDGQADMTCLCVKINPRQAPKSRYVWYVTCEFDTEYERIDNPFTEPPSIRWTSETYQEPLPGMPPKFVDYQQEPDNSQQLRSIQSVNVNQSLIAWGKGIINSAGSPYNPPAERTSSRPIITWARNVPTFQTANKVRYENTVNETAWNGLASRVAFLRSIEAEALVWRSTTFGVSDIPYYRLTFTFVLKAETWDLQLLDHGPYYLKWVGNGISGGETPTKIEFVTSSGQPRMGLLDNSDSNKPGQKLADGGTPKFNRYPVYREEDFNALGINLDLSLTQQKTKKRA